MNNDENMNNNLPEEEDHAVLYEKGSEPAEPVFSAPEVTPKAIPEAEPVSQAAPQEPAPTPVRVYQPERSSGWSEPRYEASTQGASVYTPGVTFTGSEPQPKKKKEKKGHPFLRAVALVLVCALVASAASYGVVNWVLDRRAGEAGPRNVVIGASGTEVKAGSEAPSAVLYSSEASANANAIYKNACNYQVVGVNSSVNARNIFGMPTTSAVSGTGFVISTEGYIITNYHVVSYVAQYGGNLSVMFEDGTTAKVEHIVGYSYDNDVAVIKIDPKGLKLNPVTLGNSDTIQVGEMAYAIGNPLGELTFSMTPGIVSALDRMISVSDETTGRSKTINMFQISCAVNSGNSGGPVYNAKGEVIGIVTAKYMDTGIEGLGFAIPINDAVKIAKQLIEKGVVTGAGLGVRVQNVTDVYQSTYLESYGIPYGVYVASVNEDSAAQKAGIQEEDIITALNGVAVKNLDELRAQLKLCSPGESGTITVFRSSENQRTRGQSLTLNIVFEELTSASVYDGDQPQTDNTQPETGNDDNSSSSSGDDFDFYDWFYRR